jgi:hypothetical protein
MRIPGFNAEASLDKPTGRYKMADVHGFTAPRGVYAQLPKRTQDCYAWCNLSGEDPLTCFFRCGSGY